MSNVLDEATLDRVFRTTRTYNGFTDEPVGDDELRALYDLMKWGPTSANQQPLRIIWCRSEDAKRRLADCVSEQNGPKIMKAPVAAILGMDMEFYEQLPRVFPHTDARSWFVGNQPLIEESAFRNSTLQGAYFIIAARLVGLDTGPMSGIDAPAIDKAFWAGTAVRTNFISTVGHGDPATIFERLPRFDFADVNAIL